MQPPGPLVARGVAVGTVLRDVSFVLEAGACLGVVGLNGAGKSTLLATLAGVISPLRGVLSGCSGVAYLPEGFSVDGDIRVRDWLALAPRLPGWEPEAGAQLLAKLALEPRRRVRELSQGQRVRLGLVLTLGRRAPLYLLDDPFLGLDPVAHAVAEGWIARRSEAATMVIAAQDAEALERLCTHLLLLHRGQVWGYASVEDWRSRFVSVRITGAAPAALDAVSARTLWRQARGASAVELILDDPDGGVQALLRTAGARLEALPLRMDELMAAVVAA